MFRHMLIPALFLLSVLILYGCGSEKEIISAWTNQDISIDGDASDWENKLQFMEEYNAAIGFKNDNKNLFICLAANDNMQAMQILRGGFIIWFEPVKNSDNTIGIKYPIFNQFEERDPLENRVQLFEDKEKAIPFIKKMISGQNEMQIFNKDKFPLTLLPVNNNEGIKTALGYNNFQFVYELQVPLNGYQYSISAEPGEKLKLRFETEEIDRKRMVGPGPGMGENGGGERRWGEGNGQRRRNPNGMKRPQSLEPLNFDVELTLQKSPAP